MLVPGTNLLKPEAFLPKVLAANDLKHDHMATICCSKSNARETLRTWTPC